MRRVFPLFFALCLMACLELQPQGGDDSAASSGASTGADAGGATGIDCIVEQATGVNICSGISLCPNVLVDHDLFPTCGFRPNGNVLDLECACSNAVCPIGVATTCEDAARLLAKQTQTVVCMQEYEGRCTNAAGSTSTPKKCNEDCLIRCTDNETCPKRCGCA